MRPASASANSPPGTAPVRTGHFTTNHKEAHVAETEKKPYVAPNGKHVVKLKVRFEQHNSGEVCGFDEQVARELVAKDYAEHHTPDEDTVAAHELEKAASGKPAPKPAVPTTTPAKPAK